MQFEMLRDARPATLPVAGIIVCALPGVAFWLTWFTFERGLPRLVEASAIPVFLLTPVFFGLGVATLRRVNGRISRQLWLALCLLLGLTPVAWGFMVYVFVSVAGSISH